MRSWVPQHCFNEVTDVVHTSVINSIIIRLYDITDPYSQYVQLWVDKMDIESGRVVRGGQTSSLISDFCLWDMYNCTERDKRACDIGQCVYELLMQNERNGLVGQDVVIAVVKHITKIYGHSQVLVYHEISLSGVLTIHLKDTCAEQHMTITFRQVGACNIV